MLDLISLICWAIVYLLIAFCTKKQQGEPKRAIPLLPPVLNLSWEIAALISCGAFWGHVVWFGLSVLVYESCLITLSKKKQIVYVICLSVSAVLFSLIFWANGMLVSSFVINILMSVCFWFDRKNLLLKGKVLIAFFKFAGTLAATLYYSKLSICVTVIGIGITILDIAYLIYCLKERKVYKLNLENKT